MEWLTKSEEASLSDYGEYPGSRTVEELIRNGIIILDKPPGPTKLLGISSGRCMG